MSNFKARWAVGSNIPGYMPDSEPTTYTNWRNARSSFIYDCQEAIRYDDYEGDEKTHYKIELAALKSLAKARKTCEFSLNIGGYVYWLNKI